MIVTCTNLNFISSSTEHLGDGWITPGKNYIVLGIHGTKSEIKYRIVGDDGMTPALHVNNNFEIMNPSIPQGWIFKIYPNSEWELTPASWAEDGFWESYFDGNPNAVETFRDVADALSIES